MAELTSLPSVGYPAALLKRVEDPDPGRPTSGCPVAQPGKPSSSIGPCGPRRTRDSLRASRAERVGDEGGRSARQGSWDGSFPEWRASASETFATCGHLPRRGPTPKFCSLLQNCPGVITWSCSIGSKTARAENGICGHPSNTDGAATFSPITSQPDCRNEKGRLSPTFPERCRQRIRI